MPTDPFDSPWGADIRMTMLPKMLKDKAGYRTAMVGKCVAHESRQL